MKSRVLIIVVALVLAGVAAFLSARYLRDARTDIAKESEPVEVLVAQEDVPRGTSADEMVSKEMVVLQEVPRRFTAAGAVSSPKGIAGMVLGTPLTRGQQVTADQFAAPEVAGLAFSIPKQHLALTIPVDEVSGVGGLVKPGDHVVLYATFSPGPGGEKDLTKMLLPDAKVLAVGASLRTEQSQGEGGEDGVLSSSRGEGQKTEAADTLTLAVAPADVERVVFAEETARVWCALLPATTGDLPASKGQTIRTVVK
jgi:pilus assembly protein CpaB